MQNLDPWLTAILADPITKQAQPLDAFTQINGVIDARVFLKNTYGYSDWAEGQHFYEAEFSGKDITTKAQYQAEIDGDRPIYQHFEMRGRVLDCGGGAGTVREFLAADVEFVATDPWLQAPVASSAARKSAYSCLNHPLNFIGATAEFQPFIRDSFDWVHMRSMLDHVQVVDLALLEARRVLKPGGHLLIGLYVDGGKSGVVSLERRLKDSVKAGLEFLGIDRWKDHHIWHPTYKNLLKLITDNGFVMKTLIGNPNGKTWSAMSVPESQVELGQNSLQPLNTKIIPRLFGGLGNQLFIYAAARRLALVNDAELVIDDVSGFTYDPYQRHYQLDHFNIPCRQATAAERLEPFGRLRRKMLQAWNKRRPFAQRTYLTQGSNIDFDPRLLHCKPHGTVYLEGYWQSEGYFKDVAATIRQELQIKPPTDEANLAMAEAIRSGTAVAVHVRFFDEPHADGINNAPGDYYSRAIPAMERIAPDAHYYIFSDQPAAARARIPLPDERVTLVAHNQGDENAYADLWLMRQCQHFIIANSTFSWWGAWLANNPTKQIIAPGFEMRQGSMWWGFKGLLPNEWIKL